jgi:hypothetical protein
MKYYKFVGTWLEARSYSDTSPVIGNIYKEDHLIGGDLVKIWATLEDYPNIMAEWEEVASTTLKVSIDTGKVDQVNCPAHYNKGDVVCVANVIKYLWRYEEKGKPLQDVQKAKWYLEKLLNEITLHDK